MAAATACLLCRYDALAVSQATVIITDWGEHQMQHHIYDFCMRDKL